MNFRQSIQHFLTAFSNFFKSIVQYLHSSFRIYVNKDKSDRQVLGNVIISDSSKTKLSDRIHIHHAKSEQAWQLKTESGKILVLFFPWLNSKEKHQKRYRDVYLSKGLDVLTIESVAADFLWPPNSLKFSKHALDIIAQNCNKYEYFLIHTMSIGSFNWTILRNLAARENYQSHILHKCRGVIYDSVVAGSWLGGIIDQDGRPGDAENVNATDKMIKGLAQANQNKLVQLAITYVAKFYFFLTEKDTVQFYNNMLDFFRDEPLPVPTVFFISRNDPMSDAIVIEKLCRLWKSRNLPVELKLWDESAHAQHLVKHTNEYLTMLDKFIENIFDRNISKLNTRLNI